MDGEDDGWFEVEKIMDGRTDEGGWMVEGRWTDGLMDETRNIDHGCRQARMVVGKMMDGCLRRRLRRCRWEQCWDGIH